MDRFRNILVAASPGHLDPVVLRRAVELAETNHAALTLLDVVEPIARRRRFTRGRRCAVDVHGHRVTQRTEQLRELAEGARAGDRTHVEVLVGRPFVEVTRHAMEHDHDLVIVGGSSAESSLGMPALPSGVMNLLLKCPVPVWVMRPPKADGFRVLALIDPDADDQVRDGLNARVLALATSLAQCEDGELHVGHALERSSDSASRSSSDVRPPAEGAEVPAESAGDPHRERIVGVLERHHAESDAEVHVVRGHAGEVLPRLAEGLRAEVIVMGTVARTGISGLIIGNTVETIARSADCSVLAVKPGGVVAPVPPVAGMAA